MKKDRQDKEEMKIHRKQIIIKKDGMENIIKQNIKNIGQK